MCPLLCQLTEISECIKTGPIRIVSGFPYEIPFRAQVEGLHLLTLFS
jgi:hypothetical protein